MKLRFLLFIICICIFNACIDPSADSKNKSSQEEGIEKIYLQTIHDQALLLADYMQTHASKKYNDSIVLLINLKENSGHYRFFVYDLKQKIILERGLVTHGSGSEKNKKNSELYFSNVPNSLCTSLGKYKMGYSYMGDFGKAYKMYGLEKTNDEAFNRFIVFHAHDCVPDMPVKENICLSWGCPTVSPNFFQKVAAYLESSKQPILMEIFYR